MTEEATADAAGSRDTGSIETHFTIIAVIELVLAVPGLLLGLGLIVGGLVGAGFADALAGIPAIGALIAGAGILIGLFFVAVSLPAVVSAIGLIKREPWAKPWTLVAAVLNLINFPVGTIFGIYAIWAMTRDQTDRALGRGRTVDAAA